MPIKKHLTSTSSTRRIYNSLAEYQDILSLLLATDKKLIERLAKHLNKGLWHDLDVNNFKYQAKDGEISIPHNGSLLTHALKNNSSTEAILYLLIYSNIDVTVKLNNQTALMLALEQETISISICRLILKKLAEKNIAISEEELKLATSINKNNNYDDLINSIIEHNLNLAPAISPSIIIEEKTITTTTTITTHVISHSDNLNDFKRRKILLPESMEFTQQKPLQKRKQEIIALLISIKDYCAQDIKIVTDELVSLTTLTNTRLEIAIKIEAAVAKLKFSTGMNTLREIYQAFEQNLTQELNNYLNALNNLGTLYNSWHQAHLKIFAINQESHTILSKSLQTLLFNPYKASRLSPVNYSLIVYLAKNLEFLLMIDMQNLNCLLATTTFNNIVANRCNLAESIHDVFEQLKSATNLTSLAQMHERFKTLFPHSFAETMTNHNKYLMDLVDMGFKWISISDRIVKSISPAYKTLEQQISQSAGLAQNPLSSRLRRF